MYIYIIHVFSIPSNPIPCTYILTTTDLSIHNYTIDSIYNSIIHTHIHAYIHTHIHIHTYIHTHIQRVYEPEFQLATSIAVGYLSSIEEQVEEGMILSY